MTDGDALAVRDLTGPVGAPVIHHVSLRVPHGGMELVLGPIHSGKSMLLRHILGLERADAGSVTIDGESFDPTCADEGVLRRLRTRIGVVFEGGALVGRLSVIENVELPLLEHTTASPREAREAARELLAEVGLTVGEHTLPAELGRGERRRVALARALALRPPVVLLDEPTVGLDSHAATQLDDTLARVQAARGFGVLLFSHEVRHVFGRAAHIWVMANGTIVEDGDRDALRRSDHVVVRRFLDRRGRS